MRRCRLIRQKLVEWSGVEEDSLVAWLAEPRSIISFLPLFTPCKEGRHVAQSLLPWDLALRNHKQADTPQVTLPY